MPRCAHGLEEADHHPVTLGPVVAVGAGILKHGQVWIEPGDRVREQVVVLGGLIGHRDSGALSQLAGPHAGTVDDVLALDVTALGAHAHDATVLHQDIEHRRALQDRHALHARALGEGHRGVDRIHAAVLRHVEASEQVVGARWREEVGHLARRDLVHLGAAESVEGRDAAILLEPTLIGSDLDEADGGEAGRLPGLGLQPGVEIARVVAHASRRLGEGPEGHHESGRVPGRARGEPVALEQERLGPPAHVPQVVGNGGPDDPPADDDHSCARRQFRSLGHGARRYRLPTLEKRPRRPVRAPSVNPWVLYPDPRP